MTLKYDCNANDSWHSQNKDLIILYVVRKVLLKIHIKLYDIIKRYYRYSKALKVNESCLPECVCVYIKHFEAFLL